MSGFSEAGALVGMKVMESESVPEFKESRGQERKWAHRVMWNRSQRFKIKRERMVIAFEGALIAHPNTAKILRDRIAGRDA